MVNQDRIKRKQLIREAEGYLDLMSVFDNRWQLDAEHLAIMAKRATECLEQIKNPQGFLPHILFLQGQIKRVQGNLEEAADLFGQSLRIEPENLNSLLALAWCQKRLDKLDAAVETMRDAVVVDNESAIAHYNLACYLSLKAQVKESCHHLAIALEIDPTYRDLVGPESDFDPIRNTHEFQAALSINV